MKTKFTIVISALFLFTITTKAQISTEELPYSWSDSSEIVNNSISIIILPPIDIDALSQEDENEETGSPTRFGFPHNVNITLSNSGNWETTSDGGRLWRLEILSPNALSINLLYDQFWLPDGAKFFIYSSNKSQCIGAFTSLNNKGTQENALGFATGFLFTNSIVLEYYEPEGIESDGVISISKVISGYRYVQDIVQQNTMLRHNITNNSCHNDINCSEGANWQQEKNAVAYMVMGNFICTGSLLNNTANDNAPLFLSANHCFNTSATTDQWVFYWNYESTTCNGTVAYPASNKSTTGATLLARRENSDFMLLNLIENPATNSNINVYFLGWDRTSSTASSGVGIHHPKGAQKKISIENNPIYNYPSSICWGANCSQGTSPANTHWRVYFDSGTVEGGSSGSPLLNQNHCVIGQLHGGTSGCPPNVTNYYGRFDVSWDGSNSSVRLKDWLDPLNTNESTLDGTSSCNTIYINNKTYPSTIQELLGITTFNFYGCNIEIANTTIKSNATVNIQAQEQIVLKPGFSAQSGSHVSIKIITPSIGYSMPSFASAPESKEISGEIISEITHPEEISSTTLIKVYSLTGVMVYSSTTNFDLKTLTLSEGVYIVEKTDMKGTIHREKLLLK
jgi:hypothetical protein